MPCQFRCFARRGFGELSGDDFPLDSISSVPVEQHQDFLCLLGIDNHIDPELACWMARLLPNDFKHMKS